MLLLPVLMLLLVMALLLPQQVAVLPPPTAILVTSGGGAVVQAENFEAYRDAVMEWVELNPGFSGTVSYGQLYGSGLLSASYVPKGDWTNYVSPDAPAQSGSPYAALVTVYGSGYGVSGAQIAQGANAKTGGDVAIGFNQNGSWWSPVYGYLGASAPGWVANGDVLSMAQVNW